MIPFSFLKSSAPAFNPASLALSGWWRASYAGSPWAAVASAGTSAANGAMTEATNAPSVGTAQNGLTPAAFNGTTQLLSNANDVTTFFTTAAGTAIVLLYGVSASAPTGNVYDDAVIFRDGNTDLGLSWTTSGLTAYAYPGSYVSKTVACATGGYHLAMMRWDSTNLGLTLDSAAEVTQACGALAVMTGAITLGQGYAGAKYAAVRIAEVMFAPTKLTTPDYANIKSYVNARYALSL